MSAQFWEVVGGGGKGGIVVRLGEDTASPEADSRLSTGAHVKEIDLIGERLHYCLLTGSGPDQGWVSVKLKNGNELLSKSATIWEVIGGASKGGIVVRTGEDVISPEADSRLSTGALVKELQLLRGERLHYKRLTGNGPDTGWVSLKLKGGTELLAEAASNVVRPAIEKGLKPGDVSDVVKAEPLDAEAEAELNMSLATFLDGYMQRLQSGAIVGPVETYAERLGKEPVKIAPGPVEIAPEHKDPYFERLRLAVSQNRQALANSNIPEMKPFVRLGKKELLEKATRNMSGSTYGVTIPANHEELVKLGEKWLTEALHAAGSMPSENRVARITSYKKLPTTTVDAAGGAGPKMIISVEYTNPDPNLHEELFVKMPWFADGGSKADGVDITQKGVDAFPEIAFYRYMAPLCPFRVPKYYFGDVCRENTNYILIIEKINFGKRDQETYQPHEVLPLAEKYFDFKLQPQQRCSMYYAIMKAQARMAAWYQLGLFAAVPKDSMGGFFSGMQPVGAFPWPPTLSEKQRAQARKGGDTIWSFWDEFLTRAKRCYPPELTEPKFRAAVENCIKDATTYQKDVTGYFMLFPEYISLQHPNLNADNAFFWKNDEGNFDCGIFDWDGAGPQNIVQVMTGSLTGAEAAEQDEHDVQWLRCFRDEYYQECGIRLDLGEMRRQWHLTYGIYLVFLGMNINSAVFQQTPKAEWDTITSLWDERAVGKWNVRCYTFMIGIALKYLHIRWVKGGKKRLHIHDTLLEWKDYWQKKGMS